MKAPEKLSLFLRAKKLTWPRIIFALAVAITADGLQIAFGPFGWELPDQIIDVIAFLLTMWAIGFHLLLLPTFIAELIPAVDMLPTWTACVIAVIALRKREQNKTPPANPPNVIDLPP
jgi:hypothetical protein